MRSQPIPHLTIDELSALDDRIARGESTFDEELFALTLHGCRKDDAAFEAALERALCRGGDVEGENLASEV